ncbi:MAG: hypothetical protein RJA09_1350 [Pseudomonadota bacterium]
MHLDHHPSRRLKVRPLARRLAWACGLVCGAGLNAWAFPSAGQWSYKVSGQTRGIPYTAQAQLEWQPQGTRYTARMEVKALLVGSRRQTSEGLLGAQDLQPQLFIDQRKHPKKVVLDTAQQSVRFEENGQTTPMPTGTQDRLSLFFHLGHRYQQPGPSAVGQRWTVPVVGTTGLEQWTFVVHSGEVAGQVRFSRLPRHAGDQTLDIWYAKETAAVPTRIRLTSSDGDHADQVLVKP